jgi:ABC-2 type transport system permease protein
MTRILVIAGDEWRYWLRSKLALTAMALTAILLIATTVLTAMRVDAERNGRLRHQAEAESAFLSQPDRHPHRMVHYGHYLFRTPAPLSIIDPGLDPVTGQSIFLEGHRQNTAMFADHSASADLGGLQSLTPSLVYQIFAPLLLLLLGHGAIVREREAASLGTLLAQGVSGVEIIAGKAIALLSFVLLLIAPMFVSGALAVAAGESAAAALSLGATYFLYLGLWAGLVLLASAVFHKRSLALTTLAAAWLLMVLVIPAVAVSLTARFVPAMGKIEADFKALAELREVGDGHNAGDPTFARLRSELLERHGAERVDDLPVNFRGVVAEYAEEKLTKVLNAHAETRMDTELHQANALRRLGWFSPALSLSSASRAIAGTDLEAHHRFLREAEELRYEFVQSLNRVHAQGVAYSDDVNRSSDPSAESRSRVGAENWALLDSYRFAPAPATARLENAMASLFVLTAWLAIVLSGCIIAGRRMRAWS